MVTTIMREFSAYTIKVLMDTPVAHVLKLYDLAERAASLYRYDVLIGSAALHDQSMAKGLQQVAQSNTVADPDKMRELYSKENMTRALERAMKLQTKLNGED